MKLWSFYNFAVDPNLHILKECVCIYVNPLSGSLASSIFDPLSALVGASGGVYALMGGYFMNAVVVSRFPVIFEGIYILF